MLGGATLLAVASSLLPQLCPSYPFFFCTYLPPSPFLLPPPPPPPRLFTSYSQHSEGSTPTHPGALMIAKMFGGVKWKEHRVRRTWGLGVEQKSDPHVVLPDLTDSLFCLSLPGVEA
jgi:hypothetical protein